MVVFDMLLGCCTAIVTPFDQQNKLDLRAFEALLAHSKSQNVFSVVVLGTTGERMSLTEREEELIIQSAVDQGMNVIVGSGCNCTEKSVKRTKLAKQLGAKAVLAIIPYYNRPPFRGIVKHFKAIADVGMPVIAYHHPVRTGIQLTVEELVELTEINGVAAVKEASGDLAFAERLIKTVEVPVLCGDDGLTLEMLKLGAQGTISVVSNVIPHEWNYVVECGLKGDWNEAEFVENLYKPLIEALSLEVNPIGIKYALKVLGLCKPYLRLPLCVALPNTQKAIKAAMTSVACKTGNFNLPQDSVAG